MSDKIVRDELLRSHRYQSLSSDTAKLLFLHLMLSSDSLSNAEATSTAISIIMGRAMNDEACAVLVGEMADRDLVRPYQFDGKQYVHIPRSRQRIRYLRGKHPRPPNQIEDNEIKDLIAKVGLKSDRSQTQDARSEAKRSEAMQIKGGASTEKSVDNSRPVDNSPNATPAKWWATLETITAKGRSLGVIAHPGESRDALYKRVRAALDQRKEKAK